MRTEEQRQKQLGEESEDPTSARVSALKDIMESVSMKLVAF